jgi:acyl carrier protein
VDRRELRDEIKALIIQALDLRQKTPGDIDDEVALFGDGLKLDSLDALQLAVALEEKYGLEVPEGEDGRRIFASVASIAEHVRAAREKTR